jgi:hypothetical protein
MDEQGIVRIEVGVSINADANLIGSACEIIRDTLLQLLFEILSVNRGIESYVGRVHDNL